MRKLIWAIIIFKNSFLFSQAPNLKIYYQKKNDTLTLLMDNQDSFPYSIEFFGQPKVENMRSIGEHFKNRYVIEENTTKLRLAQFVPLDIHKPSSFKKIPEFKLTPGNNWKDAAEDYIYYLPYAKGRMFAVVQGYNGGYSHKTQKILLDDSQYFDAASLGLNTKGLEKLFFDTLANMKIDKSKITLQRVDSDGVKTINLNNDGTTTPVPCS